MPILPTSSACRVPIYMGSNNKGWLSHNTISRIPSRGLTAGLSAIYNKKEGSSRGTSLKTSGASFSRRNPAGLCLESSRLCQGCPSLISHPIPIPSISSPPPALLLKDLLRLKATVPGVFDDSQPHPCKLKVVLYPDTLPQFPILNPVSGCKSVQKASLWSFGPSVHEPVWTDPIHAWCSSIQKQRYLAVRLYDTQDLHHVSKLTPVVYFNYCSPVRNPVTHGPCLPTAITHEYSTRLVSLSTAPRNMQDALLDMGKARA